MTVMTDEDQRFAEFERRIKEFESTPRVVDNRVFLLGLDRLYRDAMQTHERTELRECARRVAEVLRAEPANVPIEGYYAEDATLTEYFRLMRALQDVSDTAAPSVAGLPAFERLKAVTSSPLFGRSDPNGKLLPTGNDALSLALFQTKPTWTIAGLAQAAYEIAMRTDEISLVGLAARIRDVVVLAATRESVVLYARRGIGASPFELHPPYVWKVDEDLTRQARRFIDTFNALFGDELPPPIAAEAETYWKACDRNKILGRCVRIGDEPRVSPVQHYHWAIREAAGGELEVEDFWSPEIWTTTRYRSTHGERT
jgi:hypothetical protein